MPDLEGAPGRRAGQARRDIERRTGTGWACRLGETSHAGWLRHPLPDRDSHLEAACSIILDQRSHFHRNRLGCWVCRVLARLAPSSIAAVQGGVVAPRTLCYHAPAHSAGGILASAVLLVRLGHAVDGDAGEMPGGGCGGCGWGEQGNGGAGFDG